MLQRCGAGGPGLATAVGKLHDNRTDRAVGTRIDRQNDAHHDCAAPAADQPFASARCSHGRMIWVGYAPPKSAAHGHGPRARNPRRAWEATQSFIREHTVATLQSPLKLTVFGPSQWTDPSIVETVRAEAARAFGPPGISGDFHNWELASERLDEALEFAFADEDRPKQALGPVSLYLWFSLSWLKMPNAYPSGREHSQNGGSLGISIGGRRMFIQPAFVFAASDQDREFVARLRELEAAMPFVPNDRYYYRLEPKKSGKGSKFVKLAKGWKDAA